MSSVLGDLGKKKQRYSAPGGGLFESNIGKTQTYQGYQDYSQSFSNTYGANKPAEKPTNNSFYNSGLSDNDFDYSSMSSNSFTNNSTATYQPQQQKDTTENSTSSSFMSDIKPLPQKQQKTISNLPTYPTTQINNKYGTYWKQYEDYKAKLKHFPEFSYLSYEDDTPKTDGDIFFPEMTFQTKLEELSSKVNNLNWNIMQKSNPAVHDSKNKAVTLNNNRLLPSKTTEIQHDSTDIKKQQNHEIGANQCVLFKNSKALQLRSKGISNSNNEDKNLSGSGFTAAIEENTMSDNNDTDMPPEKNNDNSKKLSEDETSFSPEISIEVINGNNTKNPTKSLVWLNPDNRKIILKGDRSELFESLQVTKAYEEDKRSYPPQTYLDGLTQQLQQNVHSYARQNSLNPSRFIMALRDNKEMLSHKYNLSDYSAEAQDNFVLFYTLEEMNSKDDYFINMKTNQISIEYHNKLKLIDRQVVESKTNKRILEINSKNPNNYITSLRDDIDNEQGSIDFQKLRTSSIKNLTKNSLESKNEVEKRLDYYYKYLMYSNNLREIDEIIDNNPALFEDYNMNPQRYDDKSKLMLCAIAKCGKEIEIRYRTKKKHAQVLNQGHICCQNNTIFKNLKSLDKLPSEYDPVIEGFRADGISDNKIISMLNAHGEWNEQTFRVQKLLLENLEPILLKEDNFHNPDAGFLNIYYNVVNSIGTLPIGDILFDSSYLDAQRAMNGAAKQADELLGVKGGEFIREYSATAIFIGAAIATTGLITPVAEAYTVMDGIVKVRTRYTELKEQGVDDQTLYDETFEYAMQVGAIETTAKLLGFGFADGIVKDLMKNDKMRDTLKDIMMSFLQVFGYESQKHEKEPNQN